LIKKKLLKNFRRKNSNELSGMVRVGLPMRLKKGVRS